MDEETSFDLIVIGAGPAGYVGAIRAAQLGLKVACIESRKELGGTCLNVGCIPSKALLYSSEHYDKLKKHGDSLGIIASDLVFSLEKMMSRKQKIVKGLVDGVDYLFRKNKVMKFQGQAKLVSENEVKIGDKTIFGKHILLATGSKPIGLPFLPFDEEKIVSSTGALSLSKVPQKMIVVGAGVIGLELGSVYNRLGAKVTFVELMERVCPTFDQTISETLLKIFKNQGMEFHLGSSVVSGKKEGPQVSLEIKDKQGNGKTLIGDVVLVAIGRSALSQEVGLKEVGVKTDEKGRVVVDGHFKTSVSSIYAVGDLIDGPMLAHKASEEAVAAVEIIAGKKTPTVNYLAIPNVMYTSPEMASVGMTEEEAKKAGLEVRVGTFPLLANSRGHTNDAKEGIVKIIGDIKTDVCLGLHIVSEAASEMIGEGVMIMKNKMTLHEIGDSSHAHPTYSEAIKEAALAAHRKAIHF